MQLMRGERTCSRSSTRPPSTARCVRRSSMMFWERLDSPRHRRGCASIGCLPRGFPSLRAPGGAWSAACSYGTSRPGPRRPALLLGPLAVASDCRNRGIGTALVRRASSEARERGHRVVLLVGDAAYYSRFGFASEKTQALWLPRPDERHRLLAVELSAGALDGAQGLVHATGRIIPKPDLSALVGGLFAGSAPGSDFHRNKPALSPRAA